MIISNTEVTSYNTCKRQHFYRFGLNVEPKKFSLPLTRGLIGHDALEAYYTALMQGSSVDTAKSLAVGVLEEAISRTAKTYPGDLETLQAIADLKRLLDMYAEVYRVEPFKILHVESKFSTPIEGTGINYGLKLDLLVEWMTGEWRGSIIVVDHKFVYNFKTQTELEMDGQIPKYIKTVNDSGYYVTRGVFNQIRHRSMKAPSMDDIFRRTPIKPTSIETKQIWQEQGDTALEIAERKNLPLEKWDRKSIRTMSPYVCKGCSFARLCKAELLGEDTSTMLQVEFQANTYGYEDLDNVE